MHVREFENYKFRRTSDPNEMIRIVAFNLISFWYFLFANQGFPVYRGINGIWVILSAKKSLGCYLFNVYMLNN